MKRPCESDETHLWICYKTFGGLIHGQLYIDGNWSWRQELLLLVVDMFVIIVKEALDVLGREYGNLFSIDTIEFNKNENKRNSLV